MADELRKTPDRAAEPYAVINERLKALELSEADLHAYLMNPNSRAGRKVAVRYRTAHRDD